MGSEALDQDVIDELERRFRDEEQNATSSYTLKVFRSPVESVREVTLPTYLVQDFQANHLRDVRAFNHRLLFGDTGAVLYPDVAEIKKIPSAPAQWTGMIEGIRGDIVGLILDSTPEAEYAKIIASYRERLDLIKYLGAEVPSPDIHGLRSYDTQKSRVWIPIKAIAGLCMGSVILALAVALFVLGTLGILEGLYLVLASSVLIVPSVIFMRDSARPIQYKN